MKILYGLASEGMGHVIRSKVVLARLAAEHDLMIICGGRPYSLLSTQFDNVHEVVATGMAYDDNALDYLGTIGLNIKRMPQAVLRNAGVLRRIFSRFKPDIVITDFETLASLYADISGKPLISIDNMQIMGRCKVDYPKSSRINYRFTRKMVSDRVPRADHYIITSFFQAEVRKKYENRVSVVPPILRENVLGARPRSGDHILVYQTSDSNTDLPSILRESGQRFKVYGFNEEREEGNVAFKKFDESAFVEDLAGCRAVLLNGGFTAIGEAIYLHKPILSVPVERHFEQIMNAFYVQKVGYGEYAKVLSPDSLRNFLNGLGRFREKLDKYHQEGNSVLFETLEEKIGELVKKFADRKK